MNGFNKNNYRTPSYVINWVRNRFGYGNYWVDGCAESHNAVFADFIGIGGLADNFLDFDLAVLNSDKGRASLFVNPPYSNPLPFVMRAAELKELGYLVVMLLPSDKTTKWFNLAVKQATEVVDIVGGRINFLHPVTAEEVKGNNKGSMLVVFDPLVQDFATRQISLDFLKEIGANGN